MKRSAIFSISIQYEHSDRVRGPASGGIGAMHRLPQQTGLVEVIDRHVHRLKVPRWTPKTGN
jgi:hypothetical protein